MSIPPRYIPLFFLRLGLILLDRDSHGQRQRRLSWAKMIQKVYEIDPLLCTFCGAEIKILSFITQFKTINAILECMDLPPQKPEPLAHSLPWCITLDNSKGISRLRFGAKIAESMESMTYLYLCTKALQRNSCTHNRGGRLSTSRTRRPNFSRERRTSRWR